MDIYSDVIDSDPTKLQERHYYLLSELQTLVKDLPRYEYLVRPSQHSLIELIEINANEVIILSPT